MYITFFQVKVKCFALKLEPRSLIFVNFWSGVVLNVDKQKSRWIWNCEEKDSITMRLNQKVKVQTPKQHKLSVKAAMTSDLTGFAKKKKTIV